MGYGLVVFDPDEATANTGSEFLAWYDAHVRTGQGIFEGVAEWGVVGTINGWGETDDLPMTAEDVGLFKSEAIELKAGDEIKVRLNADWAVNYGADGPDGANVKVEEAGTYIVVFDLVAGTVTLEKA